MDILIQALFFVTAEVFRETISEASKDAYNKLKALIRHKFASKSDVQHVLYSLEVPSAFEESQFKDVLTKNHVDGDQEILQQAQQLFTLSPALQRAQRAAPVLQGARVLWVDDNPHYNVYECETLHALGIVVDPARSTNEGLSKLEQTRYDLVISDIEREGFSEEGLRFLLEMRKRGLYRRTIFYIGKVDLGRGTPPYAFGVADRPDDLLHYVLDVLERERRLT